MMQKLIYGVLAAFWARWHIYGHKNTKVTQIIGFYLKAAAVILYLQAPNPMNKKSQSVTTINLLKFYKPLENKMKTLYHVILKTYKIMYHNYNYKLRMIKNWN